MTPPRAPRLLSGLILGLAVVFVLVPLGPALVGHGTLIDVGSLSAYLPFRAEVGRAYSEVVTCRQDTFDYYMPGVAEIKRSLFAGHLPTWAPYEVGGAPLASLPNHGVLSPMSLPYLVLPLWLAPAYVKLLEFVVAIGGMVLLFRRWGLSTSAGLLAGMVFAASGFMVMWTNWPHTRVAALIPALFWALERLIQDLRARDVVVLGAIVASMLLGGFPAIVLFSHTLAALYVLVRLFARYRSQVPRLVRGLVYAAAGVILGVGLSAIQIVPFAKNIAEFDFANRNEIGHHLPLYTAFTLIDPYAVGTCRGGTWFGSVIPIEAVGFVGAAAGVLALIAVVLRRRVEDDRAPSTFVAVAAVLIALAIWWGGPLLAVLQVLPLWSTNYIGRAQSLFGFLVGALAGVGFDRLQRGAVDRIEPPGMSALPANRQRLRVAMLVVGSIGVAVAVTVAMIRAATAGDFVPHLLSTIWLPSLVLGASIVSAYLACRRPGPSKVLALAALALLIVVPAIAFAHTMLPTSRLADFYPSTPTHTYLSQHIGADRYGSNANLMFPATSDYYELRTPVGHEFTDQRWKDLVHAVDPKAQRTVTFSTFSSDLPFRQVQESPVLDQLAVRYWVASPRTVVGGRDRMPKSHGTVSLEDGSSAACTISSGPIRGVAVHVAETMPRTPDGSLPVLHVAVRSGGVERSGAVQIDSEIGPGQLRVAVAGEDLPNTGDTPASVRFWLTGTDGSRVFRGTKDVLDCAGVRPADDGVRLVHADAGGAIYERLDGLPRIRWASRSQIVTDPTERVAKLTAGIPTDMVLLERPGLRKSEGRPATVRVVEDERERITVQVDAEGAGYLVVADSIVRPGWHATVDGVEVPVEHADHAFAAVSVGAGPHIVEMEYRPPGLRLGVAMSVLSLLSGALILIAPTLRRWWRDKTRPDRQPG